MDDPRLSDLLLQWQEAWSQGCDIPTDQLCQACPELEQELARRVAVLRRMGQRFVAEDPAGSGTLPQRTPPCRDTPPEAGGSASGPQRVGQPRIPGYELLGELGHGGMGVVYQARQANLKRLVALKMIRGAACASRTELARFQAEAEAIAQLHHRHIVQVYDIGEHEGLPYFSLEFCSEGSLDRLLARAPLEPHPAAGLVEQLARAVHAAHQAGIVHRDLKPANVLLCRESVSPEHEGTHPNRRTDPSGPGAGQPLAGLVAKISDFGLAKRLDSDAARTRSGDVLGTPSYMAPEQARGEKAVGPAADVYALGGILYECLTGRPPFRAETAPETILQVIHDDPIRPSALRRATPRDLETICLKCLHKEPARRYRSAADLADDLRRFLGGEPVAARPATWGDRARRWRRRHPVAAALALVFGGLALTAAAAGLWYWDAYLRLTVEHYANTVNRYGVREGVGRLGAAQVRHRQSSYKLYRRAGRVERVEVVNGWDRPSGRNGGAAVLDRDGGPGRAAATRECVFTYRRGQQGELLEEKAQDQNGNVVWLLHYTTPTTAQYTLVRTGEPRRPGSDGGERAVTPLLKGLPQSRTRSGASYIEFAWSAEGYAQEVRFFDRGGRPQENDAGLFGVRYELDGRGLAVSEVNLGADGRPVMHHTTKVAVRQCEYDGLGNRTRVRFFDVSGQPCRHKDGNTGWAMRYDEWGNAVECAFSGPGGRPGLIKDGYAAWAKRYDDRGNVVDCAFFGADGWPCRCGNGYAKWVSRYDDRGNELDCAFFGPDGRPCLHREGYARWAKRYDERGNVVHCAFFGTDGQPCLIKDGYAVWAKAYDEWGNVVECAFSGADGQPCRHLNGYAKSVSRYGDRGNELECAFFGPDGRPCRHRDGYARWAKRYDDRGNVVECAFSGPDDRPCRHRQGYAKWVSRYDDRGDELECSFFGPDGRPCLHREGYARWAKRYDERGNVAECAFFGADGQPCLHRDGCARWGKQYDDLDRTIEVRNYGLDGKLCLDEDQVAVWTKKYDSRGNVIEDAVFGMDGRPCLYKDGTARWVRRYDERDQEIEGSNYGLDGEPCLDTDQVHRWVKKYDDRGNVLEESYFGIDGRPCLHKEGYACVRSKFDDRGNETEQAYFDTEGRRCATNDGEHKRISRFDERGQEVETAWFDVEGRPVLVKQGYARVTKTYDAYGRESGRTYYAMDGRVVPTCVTVQSVTAGGAGERAGLKAGDVLLSYAGRPVTHQEPFEQFIDDLIAAEQLPLVVRRAGTTVMLHIRPGTWDVELDDVVQKGDATGSSRQDP